MLLLLLLLSPVMEAQYESSNPLRAGVPVQLPCQCSVLPRPVRRAASAAAYMVMEHDG
jgi:hypothetical protein